MDEPTGRELDVAIAEVCGWTWWTWIGSKSSVESNQTRIERLIQPYSDAAEVRNSGLPTFPQAYEAGRSGNTDEKVRCPHYSTDITAAMSLGEEAERLGIEEQYAQHLFRHRYDIDAEIEWYLPESSSDGWIKLLRRFAHATAEQRATAFLRAWKEKEAKDDQ